MSNRDSDGKEKTGKAVALALEALHKQVLPFLLRQLKEDVLNDLPPKIIQDYYLLKSQHTPCLPAGPSNLLKQSHLSVDDKPQARAASEAEAPGVWKWIPEENWHEDAKTRSASSPRMPRWADLCGL
ncbi:hypothetical protein DEU56DRAFT_756383 [Suillus clintonianus]|uniref:uncharacterized protein n=1 Tax=Suillus clintonianus TaxID=1904413 RepID=UPI001B879A85|nr:uncharacterized protein DEU56DRAFT_756383 [Suillus clintonianus]KAG2135970.1 hypothetical protein DEU56DRAFT_756383 [Suillus clintonianus]